MRERNNGSNRDDANRLKYALMASEIPVRLAIVTSRSGEIV